jgi:hypothetical protein
VAQHAPQPLAGPARDDVAHHVADQIAEEDVRARLAELDGLLKAGILGTAR